MLLKMAKRNHCGYLAPYYCFLSQRRCHPTLPVHSNASSYAGIRLTRDSWNMTAVTQKCTACMSLAAAA